MGAINVSGVVNNRGAAWLGVGSVVVLAGLTAYVLATRSLPELVAVVWVAFAAMAGAAALGAHTGAERPRGLVWGYGLAAGAMVTSAAVFLVPGAIGHQASVGGFGVAAGLLTGFAGHTVGHRLLHLDLPFERTTLQLTAHALAGGAVMGVVYAADPALGPLLGVAIFSHKGPAGYAAARRLARHGKPVSAVLVPASAVGLAALPAGLLQPPATPSVQAAVFGFAAGIFLHVAMDFLPRCELGGEVYELVEVSGEDHRTLDRLRLHAVASTAVGAAAVALAWAAVQ